VTGFTAGPSTSLTSSPCFSFPPSTSYGDRRLVLTVKAGQTLSEVGRESSCSEHPTRSESRSGLLEHGRNP